MSDDPGVRWLDADEQIAWRAYLEGTARLSDWLGRGLVDAGLSLPEYEILVRLSESDSGELRMSELAVAVVHSRSRLTHTISRMEAAGLVRRVASPSDGRGVLAVLTDCGLERLVRAAPAHVTSVREALLDSMTREEFLAMGDAMARVVQRLREGGERT